MAKSENLGAGGGELMAMDCGSAGGDQVNIGELW